MDQHILFNLICRVLFDSPRAEKRTEDGDIDVSVQIDENCEIIYFRDHFDGYESLSLRKFHVETNRWVFDMDTSEENINSFLEAAEMI